MAITHATATRDAFANQVDADLGTTANMVLSAGATEVATMALNNPVFGASSSGVITMDVSPVPEDSSATGNASSVDTFELETGAGSPIVTGAVPADLTLSKNPIDAADVVQITSFTYTASA
jgi:hypothetical protein